MKRINVKIQGISPLLMHRFPMEPIVGLEKKSAKEQAEISLYQTDGKPHIPSVNILRALVAAAAFSKGKGRASLQKIVVSAVFVEGIICELNGSTSEWVVDSRPVVVPATKGRIVRHRPRFDTWETTFNITFDETLLTSQQVRTVVDDCGSRVGLLDFRPERKGPFGRFMVSHWEEL